MVSIEEKKTERHGNFSLNNNVNSNSRVHASLPKSFMKLSDPLSSEPLYIPLELLSDDMDSSKLRVRGPLPDMHEGEIKILQKNDDIQYVKIYEPNSDQVSYIPREQIPDARIQKDVIYVRTKHADEELDLHDHYTDDEDPDYIKIPHPLSEQPLTVPRTQ